MERTGERIEGLDYAVADGIARITLASPATLNALTPAVLAGLPRLVAAAPADGARVLVLTGQGRAFCAGANLGGDGIGDPDLGVEIDRYYNPLARALSASPIPIVTALNGLAAGAGVGLALAGDIVVAARSAYLLLAFANIGLVPDAGSTWLVARSVGRAKALELALLAERLPAERAAELGLIARVVDDEAVADEAQVIAAKLAAMPTRALGLIRRQLRVALDEGFDAALDEERRNQSVAGFTADHAEGVAAFREKRPAHFTGA